MSPHLEHDSDRALLARIQRSPGAKAGYKQLVRELGLGGGRERRLLLEQLTRLVKRGALTYGGQYWAIPQPATDNGTDQITSVSTRSREASQKHDSKATLLASGRERLHSGRLDLHRDGFGFVRLTEGAKLLPSGKPNSDIFIPPAALHGAMHGDLVLVDEDPVGRDGRRSGSVARVLTRRNNTIVGVFHYGRGRTPRTGRRGYADDLSGNYVVPWDERLGQIVQIPAGAEFASLATKTPHRTLDDSAALKKSQHLSQTTTRSHSEDLTEPRDDRWPLEGLVVEVEVTAFASASRPAQGRLLEVLGRPDDFGVDVEIVIRKHGIPHTFPAHVLAEAKDRAELTPASLTDVERSHREDFRDFPVVTIDGETARDFDDAVHVRALENGNTELQVHIADVSSYVLQGSALDTEARVRGTSVYFPDRAVPMLPHELSSDMCSLLPAQDRLVLSCVMEVDTKGEIVGYRILEGLIRSARRLTYTGVQHCLNASPAAGEWNSKREVTPPATAEDLLERERLALELPFLPDMLDQMLRLALQLNQKRIRRGSIDFDLPEPVVEFDPDGNMKAIVRSERGWAHRLIEEFMLSANECVATWLTAQDIPSIYRIHDMPDPKRVVDFEETAASFGETLGVGALPVKRVSLKTDRRAVRRSSSRGRESRPAQTHELPEQVLVTPQMYQRLIRRIHGKPEERILSYLMLRSLKQARYAEINEGHFALASPCYTHFTSPIRRYPDLIVHRLVRGMLRSGADRQGAAILSSDSQPWKTTAKDSESRSAAHSQPVQSPRYVNAEDQHSRIQNPAAVKTPSQQEKRAGRIGWGTAAAASFHDEVRSPLTDLPHSISSYPHRQQGPMSAAELQDIAAESSQAERRAADAERELIEWKKMKFMADKIGQDFKGIILSVTKFGFFVELDELFLEGLVPISSLTGDFYSFRDGDRAICGARNGHCFHVGDRVEVILDRIDRQQHRLQFALVPEPTPSVNTASAQRAKGQPGKERSARKTGKKNTGKAKKRRKS